MTRRRYLETFRDLQMLAACLHLTDDPPDAVVVDDICCFADTGYSLFSRRQIGLTEPCDNIKCVESASVYWLGIIGPAPCSLRLRICHLG